jgi:hypothetical protein
VASSEKTGINGRSKISFFKLGRKIMKPPTFFDRVWIPYPKDFPDYVCNFVEMSFHWGSRTCFVASSQSNQIFHSENRDFYIRNRTMEVMKVIMVVCVVAAVVLKSVYLAALPATLLAIKGIYRWQHKFVIVERKPCDEVEVHSPNISLPLTSSSVSTSTSSSANIPQPIILDPIPTTSSTVSDTSSQPILSVPVSTTSPASSTTSSAASAVSQPIELDPFPKDAYFLDEAVVAILKQLVVFFSTSKPAPPPENGRVGFIKFVHGKSENLCCSDEYLQSLKKAFLIDNDGQIPPLVKQVVLKTTGFSADDPSIVYKNPYPGKDIVEDGSVCSREKASSQRPMGVFTKLDDETRSKIYTLCQTKATQNVEIEDETLLTTLREHKMLTQHGTCFFPDSVNFLRNFLKKNSESDVVSYNESSNLILISSREPVFW